MVRCYHVSGMNNGRSRCSIFYYLLFSTSMSSLFVLAAVQEERNPAAKNETTRAKADDSPVSSQQASSVPAASPAPSWGVGGVPAHTKGISSLLSESSTDGATCTSEVISLQALLEAEKAWPNEDTPKDVITTPADFSDIVDATKKQLSCAVEWAKMVPLFASLLLEDQVSSPVGVYEKRRLLEYAVAAIDMIDLCTFK